VTDRSPQQRVLILSASFGGGHTAIARAIREYYRDHHADAVSVEIIDVLEEFAPSLNVLAKFAYQQSDEFFPTFFGTFDELAEELPGNPAVQEAKMVALPRFEAYVADTAPDAVISTYAFAGGLAAEVVGSECVSATVVPGYDGREQWLHPRTDVYFVAGRTVREQLTVAGVAWDRIVESGVPLREQFAEKVVSSDARAKLGLADKFTVLLRAEHGKPLEVWETAQRMLLAGVQVAVLTGDNDRIRERLGKEAETAGMLVVFGRVEDMNALMAASDVLVCRPGGMMLPEACAAGLPTVLAPPVPGQERSNVDFLVNYGASLMSRDIDDVVDKVRFLATHVRRIEQMGESAHMVGKPGAGQTVCERVLAAAR
jgi:processive 1,2-diacylglycerol beta-glucosyltransferase